MYWIITVLGIPVARATTLGLMGRKLKRIKGRLKALGFRSVIPIPMRSRFTDMNPTIREIRVFVMENDNLLDILTYEV